MPKASTLQSVIQRCKEIHQGKYSYENSAVYENQRTKLKIECPTHGDFEMAANNHLSGKGCRQCGLDRFTKSRLKDFKTWKEECTVKHAGTYTYEDHGEYLNSRSKMTVVCKVHGNFKVIADNHKAGQGCRDCTNEKLSMMFRKDINLWKSECTEVHKGIYDYSLCTNYINQYHKMTIICKDHGIFEQSAAAHLKGQDCPSCAKSGFDPKAEAYIYILQDSNSYKVGITNRLPEDRCKQVNKDSKHSFKVLNTFLFEQGSTAYKVEQIILKQLRQTHKQPTEIFDGSTECFYNVDLEELTEKIEKLISEHELQAF